MPHPKGNTNHMCPKYPHQGYAYLGCIAHMLIASRQLFQLEFVFCPFKKEIFLWF